MKVVLATDGNAPAEAAGRLLGRLAHRDRSEIEVVAVSGFETVLAEAEKIGHYDPAAGRERARAALAAALAGLEAAGLRAAGAVREGDPTLEILSVADECGAGLVAVGAGHTRWLERLVLGSTSTKVLHGARSSVLVVHETGDGPVRVLVGADGSAGSAAAARVFAELADPARCDVLVVAVTETPPPALVPDGEDVRRSARVAAERAAEDLTALLRDAGLRVRREVAEGDPATVLAELAEEHDLAVVGSRGMGVLRRALIGSVSDALARRGRATLVGR